MSQVGDLVDVNLDRQHHFSAGRFAFVQHWSNYYEVTTQDQKVTRVIGETVTKGATTPAKKDLFEVDEDSPKLEEKKAEVYHHIVAKMLHVAIRGRPDTLLAVAFLCTRVSCSTMEDWGKLRRLVQYLHRTQDDFMILGADSVAALTSWVDASYGVHPDMKSHTGGAMSLGRGVFACKSSKQKLNTKSSTEAELVGASDYLPNTVWAKNFLKAQGYKLETNTFNQDNQSAIKLEVNGRASAGQKSRHIDIRYFWVKDRVKSENIDIVHCPTEAMLADFFTKPLQGQLFEKFKKVLMGHAHIDTLKQNTTTALVEERVGSDDEGWIPVEGRKTTNARGRAKKAHSHKMRDADSKGVRMQVKT